VPYVSLQTSVKLDSAQKDLLQETIANLITAIPGKKPDNTMVSLLDGVSIHMGLGKADALYINVKLLGKAPLEAKGEFVTKASDALSKQLGVDKANIYINFDEYENWGTHGAIK